MAPAARASLETLAKEEGERAFACAWPAPWANVASASDAVAGRNLVDLTGDQSRR
jgi:hypothetical protein